MTSSVDTVGRPTRAQALFVLLITILVYAQSATFSFMNYDDTTYLIGNEYSHQWSSLWSYFTVAGGAKLFFRSASLPNYYRPVVSVWVLLNYKLFGLHPLFWHLVVIIAYLAAVWLLWRVAWYLIRDDLAAMAAAVLYALHPLHVEGVCWLSGSGVEMPLQLCFLGGFLSYLRWREDGRPVWLASCGILTFLALLTKESAIALPAVILAHALIFRSSQSGLGRKRLLAVVIAMVSIGAIYMLVRTAVVHAVVVSTARHGWKDIFRTAPLLFGTHLMHAIWPVRLGTFYHVQIVTDRGAALFYLPLAVCVLYAVLTIWALFRRPLAGFLLLWWMLALVPAIAAVITLPDADVFVQDRFSFVALAGLCMLAGDGLRVLPKEGKKLFGFAPAPALVLAISTISLGVLSSLQVNTWRNDLSMCLHAVAVSPQSERPRMMLGAEYARRNDLDHALAVYRDVIAMGSKQWMSYYAYGVTLIHAGNLPPAVPALMHAIELAPQVPLPYIPLADVLYEQGKAEEAEKILQQGIPVVQDSRQLRGELANIRTAETLRQQKGRQIAAK